MQLKPYPEYKESGHPFLSKIPAHWDLFRNGRLFSQRNETGFGELPILEVSLKTGVRVRDMDNLKRKQVMADREKYKRAAQGDIAYNMMRMWQGAIGVAPVDGLVSPAYVVVNPFPEADCRYFSYLFRTTAYMNEVDAYSRGIVKDRNRLYWQDFKRMPSVVPPIAEQRQIVRFLNGVGSKIQRFIRNKRQLIELLKEQKQHIINQAVTRGIDPNVKLKPSGVDWIGDIPEHWEVRRLKFLSAGMLQYGANEQSGQQNLNCPRYVRITDIKDSGELRDDTICTLPNDIAKLYLLREGDILFARSGATVGKTFCYQQSWGEAAYAGYLIRAKIDVQKINHEFVFQFTQSRVYSNWIGSSFIKATIQNISAEKYASLWITLPPHEEQELILGFIKNESDVIDQAITRTQREIELMREYRDRLIADVVTGQMDVRGIDVPEVAEEAGTNEYSPLHDEDTADADDRLDADEDLKAGE